MKASEPLDDALKVIRSGQTDSAIGDGNDLYRHFAAADVIDDGIKLKWDHLIVIDHQQTGIMEKSTPYYFTCFLLCWKVMALWRVKGQSATLLPKCLKPFFL